MASAGRRQAVGCPAGTGMLVVGGPTPWHEGRLMETPLIIAVLLLGLVVLGLALLLWRRPGEAAALIGQAELVGRLSQLAESQSTAQALLAERLQAQERALAHTLEERLNDLGRRVGDH